MNRKRLMMIVGGVLLLGLGGWLAVGTSLFAGSEKEKDSAPRVMARRVQVMHSKPMGDVGRVTFPGRAQDIRFQQALVDYRLTAIRALNEVNSVMTAYIKTQEQVSRLSESVSATRKSFKLATLQYEIGLIDFQWVLDSQSFLVRQQDNLASARRDVVQNLVRLYKALGAGGRCSRKRPFQRKRDENPRTFENPSFIKRPIVSKNIDFRQCRHGL
jgi:outer membrane protein TolC